MYQCKSGKHWWLGKEDAEKCCNGFIRILVIGGGANSQEAAGVQCGRAWMPVSEAQA